MKEMVSKYLVDKVFRELGLPPIVHASDINRVDRKTSAQGYGLLFPTLCCKNLERYWRPRFDQQGNDSTSNQILRLLRRVRI